MDEHYRDEMTAEINLPKALSARPERRRPAEIGLGRRRELMHLANEIAELALSRTEPHERCMLRAMVDMLVGPL
jgi:hypothetical protein